MFESTISLRSDQDVHGLQAFGDWAPRHSGNRHVVLKIPLEREGQFARLHVVYVAHAVGHSCGEVFVCAVEFSAKDFT